MSELELYGLMAIAKEHQAGVDRASKAVEGAAGVLQSASRGFDQARVDLQRTASTAIREAVAAECQALAAPLQLAAQKAQNAAERTQAAARTVKWLWLAMTFIAGIGFGWAGQWYFVSKDLKSLINYADATYNQTKPRTSEKAKNN
jgi:Na+/proline symporter